MPDMITLKIGNKTYDIRDSRIGNLADLDTTAKNSLVSAINEVFAGRAPTDQQVQEAVDAWLEEHPEATTTVEDGSITKAKLVAALSSEISQNTEDVADLKSALDALGYTEEPGKNLFNPEEKKDGTVLNVVNGDEASNESYKTSGFIAVTAGKKYSVFTYNNGIVIPYVSRIIAYKSDKTFLSSIGTLGYSSTTLNYVTAPENASYIRFSIENAYYELSNTLMFCEVTDAFPSELVPYTVYKYLDGYVQTDEFEAATHTLSNIEEIIEDNFVPVYSEIEATRVRGKYIASNGVISDIASQLYSVITVNVTPLASYKISARTYAGNYYFAFYDANGNFISGQKAPAGQGTTSIVDVLASAPSNAATLSVTSDNDNNTVKGVSGYVDSASVPYTGKKWVVVGDSLTEVNEATTKHYFDYITDASGIDTYNMGVGGTGYSRGYDTSRAFYQRISNCPVDADVVTIFGSGNDANIEAQAKFNGKTWAEALGSYTDSTTDTICGCVNITLDNFFGTHPTTPIGIIAPSPWQSYPTTKLTNNWFEDYTNALKQICDYRGVPFLDLYHHSNLRPENEANRNACFYNGASLDGNGDGVHPNELGHKIIAPKIYEFVKTLLLN